METEASLLRDRDADAWPAEDAMAALLENQFGAVGAVRLALPALGGRLDRAWGAVRRG